MADPAAIAWGPTLPGRMLLQYALDQPLPTMAAAAELLVPADAFMTMCSVLGHADLEPGSLSDTELQGVVSSICRQLTALGSRAPLAELASSSDFSDQRLNAFGLQATVSLTMLRGCNMVAHSTGCEDAVVRAAAALLPAFTATLRRGTAAQRAGQTEEQPIAPDYARLQVVTLLPIVSSRSGLDSSAAVQRSERASAPLIQAAPAWPAWLTAVLEALEGGPADVAEEAEGALALLLFQLLSANTSDGKARLFGPVLQAMFDDDALLERLLAAMQRAAHTALGPLGGAEAGHQKLMRLPAALVVLDSALLQGILEDQPAQLRRLLCNAAGWMARLPPAPPEPLDAESWYCAAWHKAVKLLGKLCELGDAISEEEQQEADEGAQLEAAAEGAAAAAASRREWQACREAAAAALPSAAAGFRRLLLDWPMPTDYRLQGAGELLRPLALIPHFARGGSAGGSMAGGALAACRLASAAMQAHCIGTELMYQDQARFTTNYELPKHQYMLATEAQTCCTLAAEQARRRLSAAGGVAVAAADAGAAALGPQAVEAASTSAASSAAPSPLASDPPPAVPAEEVEELSMLLWGMHLACHRIIQSVCRQPLKLVEHLFSAALAAFDAALMAMDARPQTRRTARQRQALCGAHANLLWQLVSSLKGPRFWPSEMGRRVAAQLPVLATGVPAGLYTASDEMMASFLTQLQNRMCDVQDQALLEWRDPTAALQHAVAGIDNALLASPRLLVTLVAQCGSRLAPQPGQRAGSTFELLLPAAREASSEAAGSKLGRQLAQTADALEAALRAEAAEPAVHLVRVKELGSKLARLMHQFWEQPTHVQAAHLEQGLAAAARACAYFRCGNLLADRGAAAGESGSKLRCGVCRAVNYCSRECATLDWKTGGHKRVCKALAAARQAEQAEQQAEQGAPAEVAAVP